jgi:hypothetical protein
MRRRQFIALLGGAVTASARAVHAEKPATPVIGYLGAASEAPNRPYTAAFFAGLEQSGFHDGRNVVIEYRWAEGHFDRLAALAAELVRDHVDVIFASGGTPVARAAMAATTSFPRLRPLAEMRGSLRRSKKTFDQQFRLVGGRDLRRRVLRRHLVLRRQGRGALHLVTLGTLP